MMDMVGLTPYRGNEPFPISGKPFSGRVRITQSTLPDREGFPLYLEICKKNITHKEMNPRG